MTKLIMQRQSFEQSSDVYELHFDTETLTYSIEFFDGVNWSYVGEKYTDLMKAGEYWDEIIDGHPPTPTTK